MKFLQFGPTCTTKKGVFCSLPPKTAFSMGNLELNFVNSDISNWPVAPRGISRFGPRNLARLQEATGIDYEMNAEMFMNYIQSVYPRYQDVRRRYFRTDFANNIGKIRYFLNGAFHSEYDLAKDLKEPKDGTEA